MSAPVSVRLKTIVRALEEGREIAVLYTKEGAKEPRQRTITPSHMFETRDGKVCVRAWDSFRKEVRTFRLDRMDSCRLAGEATAFVPPEGKTTVFPAAYKLRFAEPQVMADPTNYLGTGLWAEKPLASVLAA